MSGRAAVPPSTAGQASAHTSSTGRGRTSAVAVLDRASEVHEREDDFRERVDAVEAELWREAESAQTPSEPRRRRRRLRCVECGRGSADGKGWRAISDLDHSHTYCPDCAQR